MDNPNAWGRNTLCLGNYKGWRDINDLCHSELPLVQASSLKKTTLVQFFQTVTSSPNLIDSWFGVFHLHILVTISLDLTENSVRNSKAWLQLAEPPTQNTWHHFQMSFQPSLPEIISTAIHQSIIPRDSQTRGLCMDKEDKLDSKNNTQLNYLNEIGTPCPASWLKDQTGDLCPQTIEVPLGESQKL